MADSLERFRSEYFRAYRIIKKINWSDPSFTPEKAFVCAIFSKLAYLKIPEFEAHYEGAVKVVPCLTYQQLIAQERRINFDDFAHSIEIMDPIVIIGDYAVVVGAVMQNVVIVAIRGTRLLYTRDWMIDFNARRFRAHPDGDEVVYHRGFYLAITQCLGQLAAEIKKRSNNNCIPIYVTGHSLGGALAAIMYSLGGKTFSKRYKYETPGEPIIDTYSSLTFGMPRYGDVRTVTTLRSPFHIYNDKDIVPIFPPRWIGFADPPIEFRATRKKLIVLAKRERLGLRSLLSRAHLARGIRYHFIERYIRRIGVSIGLY
ncbi:MAG: lipase family protein [Proteobacteria bacterium]|nr:lipase family protein [Pseudomonadota bacterium]